MVRALFGSLLLCASSTCLSQEPKRLPVPGKEARLDALEMIKEIYRADYERATAPESRRKLSSKLHQAAKQTDNDHVGRFVLLRQAAILASRGGDATSALTIIDEMAKAYEIDATSSKVAAIEAMVTKYKVSPEAHVALADHCDGLLQQAIMEDDYPLAERIGKLVTASATKSKKTELRKQATIRLKEIASAKRTFGQVQEAIQILGQNPTDGAANLAVGKYRCLRKNDWVRGLPMLAIGSDEQLRELAKQELALPADALAKRKLGDGWWKLGENDSDETKKAMRQRGGYWYRQALPELTGLAKSLVEKRLQEVKKDAGKRGKPRITNISGDKGDGELLDTGETLNRGTLSRVGTGGDPPLRAITVIYLFRLPARKQGETVLAAHLRFGYPEIVGRPEFNADLYGLGWVSHPAKLNPNWYWAHSRDDVRTGNDLKTNIGTKEIAKLQDNLMTRRTSRGVAGTDQKGQSSLAKFLTSLYAAGAKEGDLVVLRLSMDVRIARNSPMRGYTVSLADSGDKAPVLSVKLGAK